MELKTPTCRLGRGRIARVSIEACGLGRPKPNIPRVVVAAVFSPKMWRWVFPQGDFQVVAPAMCGNISQAVRRPLPNLRDPTMRYRRIRIEGGTYFFTVVTYKRRSLLERAEAVATLMNAVDGVQSAHPFELVAHVILPDHLHMLWTLPDGDSNYPMRWRQIKSAVTRALDTADGQGHSKSRKSKGERSTWQRRYWEHTIQGESDLVAHIEYIHFNPVKHGLAARPRDWPHSSFHDWVSRGLYEANWASDAAPEFAGIVGED